MAPSHDSKNYCLQETVNKRKSCLSLESYSREAWVGATNCKKAQQFDRKGHLYAQILSNVWRLRSPHLAPPKYNLFILESEI